MSQTTLIIAHQAVPKTNTQATFLPLSYQLKSATMVCFLGARFERVHLYMQMLAGLIPLNSGTIDYFDCEKNTKIAHHFPAIAYLSDNSRLLSMINGIENVKLPALYHQLGTRKQIEQKAYQLLAELDYEANHQLLPDFMPILQQRHLLIARAIILAPKLLFIENPFAGLELAEEKIIQTYLYSLVKDKHISVICTNPSLALVKHYADNIIYCTPDTLDFFENWDDFFAVKSWHPLIA
jgi:ABC-type multidrug transport system ATPase subunit